MKRTAVFLLAVLACPQSIAETRYVTDRCDITLRSGQSTGHKVLKTLRSGDALEVLEVNNDSGYSRVRTRQGKEGWTLSRLLMGKPVARDQLAAMQARVDELEARHSEATGSLGTLSGEKEALQTERDRLVAENGKLDKELTDIRRTAANAIGLAGENRELKEKIIEMERSIQGLQLENSGLKDNTARDWFMVGAAVLVIGIILGLIIPRIRFRRKTSWDTF